MTGTRPAEVVHRVFIQVWTTHEQLGGGWAVAVVREVRDLCGQHRIINACGIDLHAYLPQFGAAGNRGDRRAGEAARERVHEPPPHRHLGALIVDSGKGLAPACIGGLRDAHPALTRTGRSEEETAELQSLNRISYAVFCLKKKKYIQEEATK